MEKLGFFATEIPEDLTFLGHKVTFPDDFFYYGAARAAFEPEIRKCVKAMRNDFNNFIGDFDDFLESGPRYLNNKLAPLVRFTVDKLSQNGCFDMTVDSFFDYYLADSFETCTALRQEMQQMQHQLDAEQAARNQQRVAQRKLNEAEGSNWLIERTINGLKWSGDQIKNGMAKDSYYDSTVKATIKNEFEEVASCMMEFFFDALYRATGKQLSLFSDDDINRASALFENLKKGNVPESHRINVALEILHLCPFTPGLLDWAVIEYGDADGELQKLADALSCYIEDTKVKVLEGTWKQLDFSTEETTLTAQKVLEEEEKRLSFYHSEYHETITGLLQDFDKKARTTDGVEYETRKEAATAAELIAFFNDLELTTEEQIISSRDAFLAKEKELDFILKKYEEKLEKLLQDKDEAARSFDGNIFETREEAQEARRQYRDMVKIICELGIDSPESTQNIINQMEAAKYTISQAAAVRKRLEEHLEILKFMPVKNIDYLRMVMSVPGKVITAVVLMILGSVTSEVSGVGTFFAILYFAFLVSLFFTTKSGLLKRMNSFIQVKNYKMAALCYELTLPALETYLNIKKDL